MGIPVPEPGCRNCYYRIEEVGESDYLIGEEWIEVTNCTEGPYRGPVYGDFKCSRYIYRHGKTGVQMARTRRNQIWKKACEERAAERAACNGGCRKCHEEAVRKAGKTGGDLLFALNSKMFVCPECGNKRCPKASNHNLDCTGSNEPGQYGSVY